MKRELKFRSWNIPNKYMYYDIQNGVTAQNEQGQMIIGLSFGKLCNDSGSIVMQYTGMHDKNGKEIYEGDILEFKKLGWSKLDFTCEIFYGKVGFQLRHEHSDWAIYTLGESEVIGNIYENLVTL